MSVLQKSCVYWTVLIAAFVAIGFVIFSSLMVRLGIFFTLLVFLLIDIIRQVLLQKQSLLISLKNGLVKLFDMITSLG